MAQALTVVFDVTDHPCKILFRTVTSTPSQPNHAEAAAFEHNRGERNPKEPQDDPKIALLGR